MSDLISRDALKEACSEMVRGSNNSDFIPCPSWNNAMELIDNAGPVNPAESVFNKLCKCGLFTGRYDAKYGNRQYMNGIWTVMETIAAFVSEDCRDRFNTEFAKNLGKSEIRAYMEGKDVSI